MQQLLGYGEYKANRSRTTIWRDMLVSPHAWNPTRTGTSSNYAPLNTAFTYYRYYVGDNQGFNADQGPRDFTPGIYPYRWGGWTNPGAANATPNFVTEQAKLAPDFWFDSTSTWDKAILRTGGVLLQSHLLSDRIMSTFGFRQDARDQRQRGTPLFRARLSRIAQPPHGLPQVCLGLVDRSGVIALVGLVERLRRNQHPRRADAALRRAVRVEGALQRR